MSDDFKYLPVAAVGDQTRVECAAHYGKGPFEKEDGTRQLKARSGNGEELWMKMRNGKESEFTTPGLNSYRSLMRLVEEDLNGHNWIKDSDYNSPKGVTSPTYEEMEDLRSEYQERLDNDSTESEEREVLREMWGEAAEMELEGRENFG